jgi:glycosyltransferase involved in cell wall biosynthesis
MDGMKKINVMAAVNPLGYGIAGLNILKELDKIADVTLFPIGQPQPTTQEDAEIVQRLANKQSEFDPSAPCVKIWHEHSLAERIGKGKYYGFPIFELNKFDTRRLKNLECCDEVITCSSWARDIVLGQTGRPENEVHVVPLGVDRTIFNEEKNKVSGTQFILFNCGKWEVRKGHDVLFRAFKMAFPEDVRDVKLFMMCNNPFQQAQQQSQQFESMYASDIRVKFVQRVNTSQEVAQIMGQVDCGVFPARGEGWNLELLEMMSMGKPVIATNYSGHTQFCDIMNCALVDIEKTEPAFDGVWFDGKVGEWASLGQSQIKQLADHMKRAYEVWKQEPVTITNPAGIETAKKFTWTNSAEKLLGVL